MKNVAETPRFPATTIIEKHNEAVSQAENRVKNAEQLVASIEAAVKECARLYLNDATQQQTLIDAQQELGAARSALGIARRDLEQEKGKLATVLELEQEEQAKLAEEQAKEARKQQIGELQAMVDQLDIQPFQDAIIQRAKVVFAELCSMVDDCASEAQRRQKLAFQASQLRAELGFPERQFPIPQPAHEIVFLKHLMSLCEQAIEADHHSGTSERMRKRLIASGFLPAPNFFSAAQ